MIAEINQPQFYQYQEILVGEGTSDGNLWNNA